jgi:dethiobiotin synthetase
MSRIVIVTGTGTEIGKTAVTAALAALAVAQGRRVAVLKPAQTGVAPGEPGDIDEVARLAGPVTGRELARFPEPLAPDTAARRSGLEPVGPRQVAEAAARLAEQHDLVLVEGAGGLLVRYDEAGDTLAEVPAELRALGVASEIVLVASAGLGVLNIAALSAEALRNRGARLTGVVIGSWPKDPDLASRCNLADLPAVSGAPLLGALPHGCTALSAPAFHDLARTSLAPELGGVWDADTFTRSVAGE